MKDEFNNNFKIVMDIQDKDKDQTVQYGSMIDFLTKVRDTHTYIHTYVHTSLSCMVVPIVTFFHTSILTYKHICIHTYVHRSLIW